MKSNVNSKKGEVLWSNYTREFLRFYNKHRFLCDEISGAKKKFYTDEKGVQREELIDRSNFLKGIQKLNAFIIDNIHYIKKNKDKLIIRGKIEAIEQRYLQDTSYHRINEKGLNISKTEAKEINKLYFNYLIEVFETSYQMSILLQDSMMISTSEIKKTLKYHVADTFFENLSKYRDEVSDDISRFSILSVDKHIRKMLGYYYTYKFMLNESDSVVIDELFSLCLGLINSDSISKYIHIGTVSESMRLNQKLELVKLGIPIKRALAKVYEVINNALSEVNILPKINKEVHIDRTGI